MNKMEQRMNSRDEIIYKDDNESLRVEKYRDERMKKLEACERSMRDFVLDNLVLVSEKAARNFLLANIELLTKDELLQEISKRMS